MFGLGKKKCQYQLCEAFLVKRDGVHPMHSENGFYKGPLETKELVGFYQIPASTYSTYEVGIPYIGVFWELYLASSLKITYTLTQNIFCSRIFLNFHP